jgi:hypothetical protein
MFTFSYPPNVSWKGKTFTQISATIQKNKNDGILTKYNLKNAPPLKIYRKEIASVVPITTQRTGILIDDINSPGGQFISSATNVYGLTMNEDAQEMNYTNNLTDRPSECLALSSGGVCLNTENNARTRVRSAGMVRKKYDTQTNNNITYNSSSQQYLVSRNRTFHQNQYNYIRTGDALAKPGDPSALLNSNQYAPSGLSHCPKYEVLTDLSFTYLFPSDTDTDTETTLTIPAGYYDIEDINSLLRSDMVENLNYYINSTTSVRTYLLSIAFNVTLDKIELQTFYTNASLFPSTTYTPAGTKTIPSGKTLCPYFYISDDVASLFGFVTGYYGYFGYSSTLPTDPTTVDSAEEITSPTNMKNYSTYGFLIGLPPYVVVHYKPNNYQYATQGSVDSSARTLRTVYNTTTNNAGKFLTAYGQQTTNALAYGNSIDTYTQKDKVGFRNICSPIVNAITGEVAKCSVYRSRR